MEKTFCLGHNIENKPASNMLKRAFFNKLKCTTLWKALQKVEYYDFCIFSEIRNTFYSVYSVYTKFDYDFGTQGPSGEQVIQINAQVIPTL